MTCIYIHYTASVVLTNSFVWPEYTFNRLQCYINPLLTYLLILIRLATILATG